VSSAKKHDSDLPDRLPPSRASIANRTQGPITRYL
jgi:hypothetical protein